MEKARTIIFILIIVGALICGGLAVMNLLKAKGGSNQQTELSSCNNFNENKLNINFETCTPCTGSIKTAGFSSTYELRGLQNNKCIFTLKTQQNMPDAQALSYLCEIPATTGNKTFQASDSNIDYTSILGYCRK